MERLLIKNVVLGKDKTNILCENGIFADMNAPEQVEGSSVIEAEGTAIMPAFYNTHTHASMSLLRGYADDIPLKEWLEDYIWPFEAKMDEKDITTGSKIALDEMCQEGSVFFNDMYFAPERTVEEVRTHGIRAAIGITVMDAHTKVQSDQKLEFIRHWQDPTGGKIQLTIAPHAVYTVCKERLQLCARQAAEFGLKLHIHVAETRTEVADCIRDHGVTPVRYLESIGVLGPNVIAAHCVHVDQEEWDILARRGVTVSHCPASNLKIGSGRFPYELAIKSGTRITLGTDGCCSNNNLDMRESMKIAAFAAKMNGEVTQLPASQILEWATVNGAECFGINAGLIEKGKLADAILVDLRNPRMIPCHNLVSNWVYSADSSCIERVLCEGKTVYCKQC